jgi:hypothetical protein
MITFTGAANRLAAVAVAMVSAAVGAQAPAAWADPAQPGVTNVVGDVQTPGSYGPAALCALATRTESVTFRTHAGEQSHTYVGPSVEDLVTAAEPAPGPDPEHPELTVAIVATGADGYAATLSWGEVAASSAPRPAVLACREDDAALSAPRLVVPGDLTGARYVNDVQTLRVIVLPAR